MGIREEAIQKITERCCVLFGVKPEDVTEQTEFIKDLGARSGNVSQMTNFLEDEFDVEISFMEFGRRKNVGAVADYIVELCDE